MSDQEWRESLKVGDEVAVSASYGGTPSIMTITHTTPKFVDIGGTRYRRSDGRIRGADAWSRLSITPVTEAIREDIRRRRVVYELTNAVSNITEKTTTDQIIAALSALKGDDE